MLLHIYRKIAPTVVLDPPQDSPIMNEEIFGPLLPIITVSFVFCYDKGTHSHSKLTKLVLILFT